MNTCVKEKSVIYQSSSAESNGNTSVRTLGSFTGNGGKPQSDKMISSELIQ